MKFGDIFKLNQSLNSANMTVEILKNQEDSLLDKSMYSPFTARIIDTQLAEGRYTMYKIVVECSNHTWFIQKRYTDFVSLNEALRKSHPKESIPKLPGRSYLPGRNVSDDFISKRQRGLQDFLNRLLENEDLSNDIYVRTFINANTQLTKDNASSSSGSDGGSGRETSACGSPEPPSVNLGRTEMKHVKPRDFDFMKVIGKGSYGKVMLAKHKNTNHYYAVKVLSKKHILNRNESKHIMQERDILVKNINHPFLVGLYYSFQTSDKLYFVLDYVNGGELFFHLTKAHKFSESRARFYAAEITLAISYLHSQGIIYRDLKPENILLDHQGHVILTDFGLCKDGLRGKETTSTFCGTPEYLAPEVIKKEKYDRTVDWWCLGAVLYEMLSGLPPFYSKNTKELYENVLHKPLTFSAGISKNAKHILTGLLEKDKTKRLGAENDGQEITHHQFFNGINWTELEKRKVKPPYVPKVNGKEDVQNIDPEFTKEPVSQSICRSTGMSVSVANHEFSGFSYAPTLESSTGVY